MSADAGYPTVLDENLVDSKRLAKLGARFDGGVDQQRVQHDSPGPVRRGYAIDRPW
jgi:hypothetical protein